MKNSKKVVLLIAVGFLQFSCETRTLQELIPVVENPTYTADIKPLIDGKCIGCHHNGGDSPTLETYDQVKHEVQEGVVICRIDNPSSCFYSSYMPPEGRMPQQMIDMVKNWNTDGCPE